MERKKRYPAGVSPIRDQLARILRRKKGEWVPVADVATELYGSAGLPERKRCVALVRLIRRDETLPYSIDTWRRGKTQASFYRLRDRSLNSSGIIGSDADFLKTNLRVVRGSIRHTSTDLRRATPTRRVVRSSSQ